MKKYMTFNSRWQELEANLNRYAANGWRLVNVTDGAFGAHVVMERDEPVMKPWPGETM